MQQKPQLDIRFMTQPMMPVSLMVTISSSETTTDMAKEATGPSMKPPMVIITSLGSYLRNMTTGMRMKATTTKAMAQSMPMVTSFLVEIFMLYTAPCKEIRRRLRNMSGAPAMKINA